MRRAIFVLVIAFAACHRAETFETRPPRSLPDRMTAIKNERPPLWPKPEQSMLGCYHVDGKGPLLPTELELTSERGNDEDGLQQHYVLRLRGRSARDFGMSSWILTDKGAQISLSTGFVGWIFEVQKSSEGFRGTARWWTDAGEQQDVPVVLKKVTCR